MSVLVRYVFFHRFLGILSIIVQKMSKHVLITKFFLFQLERSMKKTLHSEVKEVFFMPINRKFLIIMACSASMCLGADHDPLTKKCRDRVTQELPLLLKNHDGDDVGSRVDVYLKSGGNPNLCDYFGTFVLHMSAHYGHEHGVKLLVEASDIDAMALDALGFTARDYAKVALHASTIIRL